MAPWAGSQPLRALLDDRVRGLVPAGPVALLDAPSFWSVGDNAIWTIEQEMATRFGWDVRYSATTKTFDIERLDRLLPDGGTIVFSAGGSLGDVWPKPQWIRELVCRRFTDRRVVVLTQGAYFSEPKNLERAKEAFNRHPDLHLMVRDALSAERAEEAFPEAEVQLSPDLVLWLGAVPRSAPPTRDVLLLLRRDVESRWPDGVSGGASWPEAVDWADAALFDEGWRPAEARYRRFVRMRNRLPRLMGPAAVAEMNAITDLAAARFRAGVAMLSSGRVVVTDRLHAHVLCLLMDIPHVVLDNNFGKLAALMDAWTAGSPLVHRADTPEDAMDIAGTLLAEGPGDGR